MAHLQRGNASEMGQNTSRWGTKNCEARMVQRVTTAVCSPKVALRAKQETLVKGKQSEGSPGRNVSCPLVG